MKIGFFNFHPMTYDVETPLVEPLGGSESAMCYLAVQLAALGHEVILFRRFGDVFTKWGVKHMPLRMVVDQHLDVLINQNTPFSGAQLRIKRLIDPKTKLIFWSQHASNQPPVEVLFDKAFSSAFDKFVLISDWQSKDYIKVFKLPKSKISILRNAISPAFENIKGKKRPLSMAYTSTPFRGLDLLLGIFSKVKTLHSSATLSVFSSMKVYQAPDREAAYEKLYEACRQTYGVNYVGSVPQKTLANELAGIQILAYPNVFPETSCIAVMEAMAAGCQIVTSNLGALPETTAGFGRLVKIADDHTGFSDDFADELMKPIDQLQIEKQVEYVNKNYTWKQRASEWEKMLADLIRA